MYGGDEEWCCPPVSIVNMEGGREQISWGGGDVEECHKVQRVYLTGIGDNKEGCDSWAEVRELPLIEGR